MREVQRPEAERIYHDFLSKNQLTKGSKGEEREDAEYYWSTDGRMWSEPREDRYPVYRTNTPRKHKQGNCTDF